MDVMTFLSSLPAILGIVGFFAYLWSGQQRIGGELIKGIADKLRGSPNINVEDYKTLMPSKLEKIISRDERVRRLVNKHDIATLRLIVLLQYMTTTIVFLACAALVGLGIWLISRPAPLSIVPHPPVSAVKNSSSEILVDLDPMTVSWDAFGKTEEISVFLENPESLARSEKKRVLSDLRKIDFDPDDVRRIATSRKYRGKNSIRVVVEWSSNTVRSRAVDVFVGIEVQLMIGGRLIGRNEDRPINTLVATIDDSTENMPIDYCFFVDFVGWNQSGPLVVPLNACNNSSEIKLPSLSDLNKDRLVGLVFNRPIADRNIVRACIGSADLVAKKC